MGGNCQFMKQQIANIDIQSYINKKMLGGGIN